MTYLFKLARRAARFRAFLLPALALASAACNTDQLTSSSEEPAAPPTGVSVAGPASFVTGFTGGIPFGITGQPNSSFGPDFNGGLRIINDDDLMADLAAIKSRGGRVMVNLAGGQPRFTDGAGHFSLTMWKASIDRFKGLNLTPYIDDGTIIGNYLIDEPTDASNWNGTIVSPATLDEMAKYSKQYWPKMATFVRAEPHQIAWTSRYQYLDAAWAQYVARKGDVGDFIRRNITDAKNMGLGLVTGLNVLKGALGGVAMTPSQIQSWGSALLAADYPCAFISWEYDQDFLARADIKAALAILSQAARAHSTRSCDGTQTDPPPVPQPGIKGIVLKTALRVVSTKQYIDLTWAGARTTTVDIYRNKILTRTTKNDGKAVSGPWLKGEPRSFAFKLCDKGSTRCSNIVTVSIN
jgi:hypothetical protein